MVDIRRFPPTHELVPDMMREAQAIGETLGANFRVPPEKRITGTPTPCIDAVYACTAPLARTLADAQDKPGAASR